MTGAAALSSLPGCLSSSTALFSGILRSCFSTISRVKTVHLKAGMSDGFGGVNVIAEGSHLARY